MTIVVEDAKSGTEVQNPDVSPQQDTRRRLSLTADFLTVIGSTLFLICGLIRLYMNITFDS